MINYTEYKGFKYYSVAAGNWRIRFPSGLYVNKTNFANEEEVRTFIDSITTLF